MFQLDFLCPLVAQAELRDLSRGFQPESRDWTITLVFLFMLLIFAGIIVWVWHLGRTAEKISKLDNPDQLFIELSRAHRLSREERTIIKQLASALQLDSPALLFVRQDLFRQAISRSQFDSDSQERASELQAKLFVPIPESQQDSDFSERSIPVDNSSNA